MRPSRLFYDDLLASLHAKPRGLEARIEGQELLRSRLHATLIGTSIVYVNAAVAESLSELSPAETAYDALDHLPFPRIFFEFSDPLPLPLMRQDGARAIHFGPASRISMFGDPGQDVFCATVFYPQGTAELLLSRQDIEGYRAGKDPAFLYGTDRPGHDSGEEAAGSIRKARDLCCNLVDYINAHNVTLRKEERETRDIDGINRKRRKKGKRQLDPLAPYHWVEIRQQEVPEERKRAGDEMGYRELVRGHFQRYHAVHGTVRNWIDPYVRGPEGAPWKDKRYELLANLLARGALPG